MKSEWLLVIVLLSPNDDVEPEPLRFATEADCMTAATAFVAEYPAFELRDRSDDRRIARPVLRSYVECVPADQDPRGDHL